MRSPISMDKSWNGIPHEVPARNESRLLIETEVDPVNGIALAGQFVEHGAPRKLVIYKSQLKEIQGLLRTEAERVALANAKATYDAQVAEIRKAFPAVLNADEELGLDMRVKSLTTTPWAILAENPQYKAGIGPVLSLKVIEDVPAPPTLESAAIIETMTGGEITASDWMRPGLDPGADDAPHLATG